MPVKEMTLNTISFFDTETGEKIADVNSGDVTLEMHSELETDYIRDKDNHKLFPITIEKSKTATLDFKSNLDKNKLNYILGIDQSDISDNFNMQYIAKTQIRRHKKRRINKKWAKRYGYYYNYVDMGNWNVKSGANGEVVMQKRRENDYK